MKKWKKLQAKKAEEAFQLLKKAKLKSEIFSKLYFAIFEGINDLISNRILHFSKNKVYLKIQG